MLQACVCTHNPRLDIFRRVLGSIARQSRRPPGFELVIIDNASDPPLCEAECMAILGSTPVRIEREPRLGIAAARARAVSVTSAEWVLLVDDDTELAPDYLECALRVIARTPGLGCFGGKLLLPGDLVVDPWMRPLLGFLAIRDAGDAPITACSGEWGVWEPPAAGAVVRRPLLERYCAVVQANRSASQLGRKGVRSFGAGEDALLMSGAYELGLSASYQPSLRLTHHLDPSRLEFTYLMRLMYGHGRSRIILERVLRDCGRQPAPAIGPILLARTARAFYRTFVQDPLVSLRYACCTAAYRAGSAFARLRLAQQSPPPLDTNDAASA